MQIFFLLLPIIVTIVTIILNLFFASNFALFSELSVSNPLFSIVLITTLVTVTFIRFYGFMGGLTINRVVPLWVFFGSISIMLIANIFGYLGFAKLVFILITAGFLLGTLLPRFGVYLTQSGRREDEALRTAERRIPGRGGNDSNWWMWPIGFLVVLITLGAISRCNTGTQTQQTSNTTGNSAPNSNAQSGNTSGQQRSLRGQEGTITNLHELDEFRESSNGTSGLGATDEEEVTGLGAL